MSDWKNQAYLLRERGTKGFWAGLLASLPIVGALLALPPLLGILSPLQPLVGWLVLAMPPVLFSFLLELLGYWAKILLMVGILAMLTAAGGGMGGVWASLALWMPWRRVGTGERSWWVVDAVALSLFLWFLAWAWSLTSGTDYFPWPFFVPLSLAYSASLTYMYRRLSSIAAKSPSPVVDLGRRQFVGKLSVGIVAVAAGGALYRFYSPLERLGIASSVTTPPPSEITPNDKFYTVSKNFFDPVVSSAGWRLRVQGLVGRPLSLSYEELKALPQVMEMVTLECISNSVGGDLMGNARWRGVPLAFLLGTAGVKPEVQDVVFRATDDYADSIPLSKALDEATLVAYEMNGEPLSPKHGFPARIIVPGIYGMKNVKWVTDIELVDHDFLGFWQEVGWSDEASIKTTSRIDWPVNGLRLPMGMVGLTGVAVGGDRGIVRVEVSTDGGKQWQPAQLQEARSSYSWVLWRYSWFPAGPGTYDIKVRAIDGTGWPQASVVAEPFPDGASGYHTVFVQIIA
ncbi:MAG: molybdopterin-dependent oxidoreductase [Chloroflexi bacterium]|nr:molybdopterin-dependent oxidoreductase [Chloroflexota bacterium]